MLLTRSVFQNFGNRRTDMSTATAVISREPLTILRLHRELQPDTISSCQDHTDIFPRYHIMFLIQGPQFLAQNWSWQFLVLLLKLEYHSLCIYMYVSSNPPSVSIVYFFFLLHLRKCTAQCNSFCITHYMTGHTATVKSREAFCCLSYSL